MCKELKFQRTWICNNIEFLIANQYQIGLFALFLFAKKKKSHFIHRKLNYICEPFSTSKRANLYIQVYDMYGCIEEEASIDHLKWIANIFLMLLLLEYDDRLISIRKVHERNNKIPRTFTQIAELKRITTKTENKKIITRYFDKSLLSIWHI